MVQPLWKIVWQFFKNSRKVYVIDFPGESGESGEPPEAWGIPEYAEMTKAFIEQNQIEGCDVIAHSFGGRVTIYLASRYDKIFDKIITIRRRTNECIKQFRN